METKYDGERVQVHVDRTLPRHQQVQIFSKSTRDSTEDRARLVPIIRAALGLSFLPTEVDGDTQLTDRLSRRSFNAFLATLSSGIFEGEMTVYNETLGCDDLFYKLSCVKEGKEMDDSQSTHKSVDTDDENVSPLKRGKDKPNLHLKVVFFVSCHRFPFASYRLMFLITL